MLKYTIPSLCLLILTSCASMDSHYRARSGGDFYGYREIKIDKNKFLLSYIHPGNEELKAHQYLYKRALEIAQTQKKKYVWVKEVTPEQAEKYRDDLMKGPSIKDIHFRLLKEIRLRDTTPQTGNYLTQEHIVEAIDTCLTMDCFNEAIE